MLCNAPVGKRELASGPPPRIDVGRCDPIEQEAAPAVDDSEAADPRNDQEGKPRGDRDDAAGVVEGVDLTIEPRTISVTVGAWQNARPGRRRIGGATRPTLELHLRVESTFFHPLSSLFCRRRLRKGPDLADQSGRAPTTSRHHAYVLHRAQVLELVRLAWRYHNPLSRIGHDDQRHAFVLDRITMVADQ